MEWTNDVPVIFYFQKMFLSSSEQSGGVSLAAEGKERKSALRNTPHTVCHSWLPG
jgi:hypothetical protein